MRRNAESLVALHTHTHTHTLCLQDKNLKKLGLLSVAQKLYIKYENIKVDFSHGDVSSGMSNKKFDNSQMEASPCEKSTF